MARLTQRLNARSVQVAKTPGMIPDGGGLYLHIGPSGSKSWVLRYRMNGHRRDLGLGPYPLVLLAEARARAMAQLKLRLDGIDPLAARRAVRTPAQAMMTFAACAEEYIEAHSAGWRGGGSEEQWRHSLRDHAAALADMPIAEIDTAAVLRAVQPIWNTKTETASRVRGRIESILGWATTKGLRTGDNPARWPKHLENLLPAKNKVAPVKHHVALDYREIAGFMAELRVKMGIAAKALEFTILTASRVSEVVGARWSEFDLAERLWTVPAARIKGGIEHRVPLSDAAMALIEGMPRRGDRVFPVTTSALSKVILEQLGRRGLTIHGFRSTFRDWAAERTNFPAEVADMALAHVVGDKVEAAYRRGDLFDKRRQLADAWARYIAGQEDHKVVPLRA